MLVSNTIKDNILLLNIIKDMGVHQDISRASVELMNYVIKPGSITEKVQNSPEDLTDCLKLWNK